MTLVLSLLVVGILFTGLFFLLMINKGNRANHLRQCADHLALRYRPYASLSKQIREADFYVIRIGQFQHFRHLIEGESSLPATPGDSKNEQPTQKFSINIFDYSMVNNHGSANQTLILLSCPLRLSPFRWQAKEWLVADSFNEPEKDAMQRLQPGQVNAEVSHWQLYSQRVAELPGLLNHEVRQWLLAHPHLHIEWSNGILLLYRPHLVLDADQIEVALKQAAVLAALLQQHHQPH